MTSRSFGMLSLALSACSIVLMYPGMRLLPGISSLLLITCLVGALGCSVRAALHGTKLWLLASVCPIGYLIVLTLSVFAGEWP